MIPEPDTWHSRRLVSYDWALTLSGGDTEVMLPRESRVAYISHGDGITRVVMEMLTAGLTTAVWRVRLVTIGSLIPPGYILFGHVPDTGYFLYGAMTS